MSKNLFYQQLLLEEKELQEALDSIKKLKNYYKVDSEKKQSTLEFEEPEHNIVPSVNGSDEYDSNFTNEQKIFFVLRKLGSSIVPDIAKYLVSIDDYYSEESAKKMATLQCSKLYRAGKLSAVDVGNRYKYSIKQ